MKGVVIAVGTHRTKVAEESLKLVVVSDLKVEFKYLTIQLFPRDADWSSFRGTLTDCND
jgi:hypothetical protein